MRQTTIFVRTFGILGVLLSSAAHAQNTPGGGGQGGGFSPLVPDGIEYIGAYPVDNSLIVKARGDRRTAKNEKGDAPTRYAAGTINVRPQWLEMFRSSSQSSVRRFQTIDSPVTNLVANKTGKIEIASAVQTAAYPAQVQVEEGVITVTIYSPADPQTVLYRVTKKDGVKSGDSIIVKGLTMNAANGEQRESYLQLTFEIVKPEEKADGKKAADREAAPVRPAPTQPDAPRK